MTKVVPKRTWVLIEVISSYRIRYVVEAESSDPQSVGRAIDMVTSLDSVNEFSQLHIGEQIISHRIISESDALNLCDEDNEFIAHIPDEKKLENYFTRSSNV
jgi:hypothetical protein